MWIMKNGKSYYGYKDYIKVDWKSKLIIVYWVIFVNVYDNVIIGELVIKKD